jgi:two-component system invasion response regulator UvrY
MLNVMLIDNHDLIRCGIKFILNDVKNVAIVGEGETCEEVMNQAKENQVDIAIISLNKFDVSRLDGIQKLMRRIKSLKVIVITDCMNEVILSYLLKSGVHGALSMNTNPEELTQALGAVKSGSRYVSTEIANQLAAATIATEEPSPFKRLSCRELQVVLLIVHGMSPREIAEKLFLSAKTISTYRNNIFNKLGVKNEVEMTRLAY